MVAAMYEAFKMVGLKGCLAWGVGLFLLLVLLFIMALRAG